MKKANHLERLWAAEVLGFHRDPAAVLAHVFSVPDKLLVLLKVGLVQLVAAQVLAVFLMCHQIPRLCTGSMRDKELGWAYQGMAQPSALGSLPPVRTPVSGFLWIICPLPKNPRLHPEDGTTSCPMLASSLITLTLISSSM